MIQRRRKPRTAEEKKALSRLFRKVLKPQRERNQRSYRKAVFDCTDVELEACE